MAVTAFKASGTQADAGAGHGTVTWATPTNAAASDGVYTTASVNASAISHFLRLTNFGFTSADIPGGSSIDGIEVHLKRKLGAGVGVFDESIILRNTSGQVGNNKADTVTNWGTDATITYGGAADTWAAGLVATDIVGNSNFGIDVACKGAASTGTGSVDYLEIGVYFTAPPVGGDIYSQNMPALLSW